MTFVRQLGVNVGKTDANSVLPQRELRLARMMLRGFKGRLGRRKKTKKQKRGRGGGEEERELRVPEVETSKRRKPEQVWVQLAWSYQ